jgi:cytochrome c
MSFFLLKSILALFLLAAAASAVLSMLTLMGKAEKKLDPNTLRQIHIISGRLFLFLLLPLLILGMSYWVKIGDQASIRAVLHAVLALGLIGIFLLKVVIVKFYKQLLRFAPVLGMLVFCFAFVVASISVGFYAARALSAKPAQSEEIDVVSSKIAGNADKGAFLYDTNCLSCHHADSEDKKIGPGLKGLFKKDKLPYTGRPTTIENAKQQLLRPASAMPSFAKLTEQELEDLIAYLQTL